MHASANATSSLKPSHWTDFVLAILGLFALSLVAVLAADALSVEHAPTASVPALLWQHALHVFALLFQKLWFYSALLLVGAFNSVVIVGGVQLLRHWDRRLSRALQRRTLRVGTRSNAAPREPLANWLEEHGSNRNGVEELVLRPLGQS
jgi:hypothetical protein